MCLFVCLHVCVHACVHFCMHVFVLTCPLDVNAHPPDKHGLGAVPDGELGAVGREVDHTL